MKKSREIKRDAVVNVLFAIEKRDNIITAEATVKEAEPVSSPLHNKFEWDDTEAGRKFRLAQARQLINYYHEIKRPGQKDQPTRFFHVEVNGQSGYVNEERVKSHGGFMAQVTREALASLEGWDERYKYIKSLAGIIDKPKLDKAIKKLSVKGEK